MSISDSASTHSPLPLQAVTTSASPVGSSASESLSADLGFTGTELEYAVQLRAYWQNERRNAELVDELLYKLHDALAGKGREGQFTRFLREVLGWKGNRPDKKACRRIARHKFSIGLITKDEYDKIMGNHSSGPSRTASKKLNRPTPPPFEQTFSTETVEEADVLPPVLREEEIQAGQEELEARRGVHFENVLYRAQFPAGYRDWFKSAWRIQAKRHGTKTFADTLAAIVMLGTIQADPDDEWGTTMSELLAEIHRQPELASQPEPEWVLEEWEWDPTEDFEPLTLEELENLAGPPDLPDYGEEPWE